MTYIIYLVVCCAIMLGLIYYGMRAQRKKQEAFFQQQMDEVLSDVLSDKPLQAGKERAILRAKGRPFFYMLSSCLSSSRYARIKAVRCSARTRPVRVVMVSPSLKSFV